MRSGLGGEKKERKIRRHSSGPYVLRIVLDDLLWSNASPSFKNHGKYTRALSSYQVHVIMCCKTARNTLSW
jgi:hypothetical protein